MATNTSQSAPKDDSFICLVEILRGRLGVAEIVMDKNSEMPIDFYIIETDFDGDRAQCMRLFEDRKDIQEYAKRQILARKKNAPAEHEKIVNLIKSRHNVRLIEKAGKLKPLTDV